MSNIQKSCGMSNCWEILISTLARKHFKDIARIGKEQEVKQLIKILCNNPYQSPPPYEKLNGNLKGKYSRRINSKHRLVYEILETEKTVKILSIWSHYEQ